MGDISCNSNTLQLLLDGDKSAVKVVLSDLFGSGTDASKVKKVYKYNRVDPDLEGLEVNLIVSDKHIRGAIQAHAVILAVDVTADGDGQFDIEEGLMTHAGINTVVLILNNTLCLQKPIWKTDIGPQEYAFIPRVNQIPTIKKKYDDWEKHFVKFTETNYENLGGTFDTIINMALILFR